jgi:hypothetical protein
LSRASTSSIELANNLLSHIERLLNELRVHDNEDKRGQLLSLLDSLSRATVRLVTDKKLLRPTGETIRTVADLLNPLNTKISRLRLAVLQRRYEEALEELHVIVSPEGEEPGLIPLYNTVTALMNLITHEVVPEEVAQTVPDVMLTPPTDLMYGVPPITLPLWNLLVRRGKLEKEEAKRALIPPTAPEQLDREFEEAWETLVERGYAELKIDKRGNQFLERKWPWKHP